MELPTVSSGSFEFYEGLRVLAPGSFVVALYVGIGNTFGFVAGAGGIDALSAILSTLFVGMIFLFIDVPSKAAVFAFESPELVLKTWSNRPPQGGNHLNVYYEVLDTIVPPAIRTRTYYLGVIYRIGFESIYLLALPGLAVLTLSALYPEVGKPAASIDASASRIILAVAAVFVLVSLIASISGRYDEHGNKGVPGGMPRLRSVLMDVRREVPWPDRVGLLAGVGAAFAYALLGINRWLAAAGIVLVGGIWAFRYLVGVPRQDMSVGRTGTMPPLRQNLHGVSASFLFALASLTTLGCCFAGARTSTTLTPMASIGWSTAVVLAALLIHFRGHERKLLGSYGLQRTWLLRNRARIERDYYSVIEPPSPDPATAEVGRKLDAPPQPDA